ncbi:MAG: hypothetical protein IIB54_03415 [Planctomycetes bacterium]|nr:hypothetical protein [Planctomycetota bacterium]
MLVGLLLLIAAILVIWERRELIGDALEAVRHPAPLDVAILLGCVAINIMLSGVVFHLLMLRYGKVGFFEMQALIASATLFNYLPLRPGLLGRIAYHKAVNNIAVVDSAKTVFQAMLCSLLVAGWLGVALGISRWLDISIWIGVILPMPILLGSGLFSTWRLWLWALGARYIDLMVWAVRYWVAFKLIGVDIAPATALACACIGMFTMLIPFFSNGLGLREWAIGLTTPLFDDQIVLMEIGMTADLVNRAAEVMGVLALGLVGIGLLLLSRKLHTKEKP